MNFVIARPWYKDKPEGPLCIYSYASEVQQNQTMTDAHDMLAYVKRQCPKDKDWAIYEVEFKKVK